MGRFSLGDKYEHRKIGALSDGQKSRVAFAMLDWHSPHLIIMYEEAEALLLVVRYEVVVRMYQALGRWTRAIAVCEEHDRVNLAAAFFEYARFQSESGKAL